MDGILKVEPQKLISTSQEFSSAGSNVRQLTSEMVNIMTALQSTWQSEASSAYVSKAKSLDGDIAKLNGMIQEHVNDLQEMAQQYMTAEQAAQAEADALQTSVIS